jgi:hypothetical protein
VQPCARPIKIGFPPTARHARTGLFTPPGINRAARANRRSERTVVAMWRGTAGDARCRYHCGPVQSRRARRRTAPSRIQSHAGRRRQSGRASSSPSRPAAAMGKAARAPTDSSPTRNSRLISKPAIRKNTAMRPSLIHARSESVTTCPAGPTLSGTSQRRTYYYER